MHPNLHKGNHRPGHEDEEDSRQSVGAVLEEGAEAGQEGGQEGAEAGQEDAEAGQEGAEAWQAGPGEGFTGRLTAMQGCFRGRGRACVGRRGPGTPWARIWWPRARERKAWHGASSI